MLKDVKQESEFTPTVVSINRVTKVVKGGRRFGFNALVVVGNSATGQVGIGMGKGKEVPVAITKAIQKANKNLIKVPVINGTIPFPLTWKYGAAKIFLTPAPPGTGVIAGGPVRSVVESAGIKDIRTKSLGSNNAINMAKGTFDALKEIKRYYELSKKRLNNASVSNDDTDD
jgi:small subunit ribosomal protein S5